MVLINSKEHNLKQLRLKIKTFQRKQVYKMKPSLTFILFGIFFLLIARSMYSIYEIFQKPTCTKSDIKCYKSILNTKPDLDLYVFVSDSSRSPNYQLALQKTTFDYLNPFEE